MYARRIEDYKAPWEIKLEASRTIEELVGISFGIGKRVHVTEMCDALGRIHPAAKSEFYGIILEEHPRWIRILRKAFMQDYVVTVHKADILTGHAVVDVL